MENLKIYLSLTALLFMLVGRSNFDNLVTIALRNYAKEYPSENITQLMDMSKVIQIWMKSEKF